MTRMRDKHSLNWKELEDMGTLLEVRLVMDVASYQFPLNQRYLIQMSSFLLYH